MRFITRLKQSEVTELTGIPQSMLSQYETEARKPSIGTYLTLMKLYTDDGFNLDEYLKLFPKPKRTVEHLRFQKLLKESKELMEAEYSKGKVMIFNSESEYKEYLKELDKMQIK